jgi:anti-anti-sigma factor
MAVFCGVRLMEGPEDASRGPSRVSVEVDVRPEAVTIVIRGELDLVTLPVLAGQLAPVCRDKPERLVFDLAGTSFMDCGSARLIAGSGSWLRGSRRPVLRHPGPEVRRILELTGLDANCYIEEA